MENDKNTLKARLNISNERWDILQKKILEEYQLFSEGKNDSKDTIDVVEKLREISQSANEDVLICYSIGALHLGFMKEKEQKHIASLIQQFLK